MHLQLGELAGGSFVDRGVNVLAFGLPGTGKTHVMCAVGHRLVESGRSVLFAPAYRLVQDLLAAKRDALPHPKRYSTKVVASTKMLPKTREAATWAGHIQDGEAGLVATSRDRYRGSSKKDKGRILDEFTAITGHHRKHGIRLLGGATANQGKQVVGRRI